MDDKGGRPSHEEISNGHSHEAMPQKRGGVINTLYPPGPKPGAGGRIKNHCRRFWWCDLLVVAVIALVIVLPIVYVAIPKKAQHDINASTLEVTSQEVTNPTPESIHLKLVTLAKSGSNFHPTIEGFRAGLSLKDQEPFLYIDIPEAKAEAETSIVAEADVNFENMDRFAEYNKVALGSESFDVYVDGKTKVHQSGLKAISVDYNKKVTMKGLNKLSGLNITSIRILSGRNEILEDGSNMIGNVTIPNPSVMTLSLGNVTMNLAVDNTTIGYALLPDLVLKPGDNLVPMQSTVDQLTVISLITSKYQNAIIPLEITGNSSVANGQHLTYFESAIKENVVKMDLNVGPALAAIGINTTSLIEGGN